MTRLGRHAARVLCALLPCLSCLPTPPCCEEPGPGLSFPQRRAIAVWQAFAWMKTQGRRAAVLRDYGSDFMEFYYELATSAAIPELRRKALAEGRALGRRYVALAGEARDAEQAVDIISALALLPDLGLHDPTLRAKAERAAQRFRSDLVLSLGPGDRSDDPEDLCDAIIGLHFARRAGLDVGHALDSALQQAAHYQYQAPTALSEDGQTAQDNLASHIVYVASDYGRLSLAHCSMERHRDFMLGSMRRLMAEDDVEMVAEFVDSLRIMGLPDDHPTMLAALRWVLADQNADGSFGDPQWQDIYDRYHATWTALNALRGFRFQGAGPRWQAWPCVPRALERP